VDGGTSRDCHRRQAADRERRAIHGESESEMGRDGSGRHGGDPADAFDLVVPSLPGFGFSSPLRRAGVNRRTTAQRWRALMRDVLGYDRYFASGGDWGSFVTQDLAEFYPDGLQAIYVSLPVPPGVDVRSLSESEYAPDEAWMVARTREAAPYIQSHLAVHAREPQTLAYALNDSPAGLAAWLWTRRRWWSDCGGDVLSAFDRDFLCATASLYWFTRTIGSSMRYYAEAARMTPTPREGRRIEVPTAFAVAPKELLMVPRRIAAEKVNLQRWSVLPRGGHFVFAEQPQLMVQELREFFRDYR